MEDLVHSIFSNQVLAVVLPGVVFGITVYMLFKRLISFLVTLTLLAFALLSGFAFLHHEDVAAYLRGEVPEEQVQAFKKDLMDFKDQLYTVISELKTELPRGTAVDSRLQEQQAKLDDIQERFSQLEDALAAKAAETGEG